MSHGCITFIPYTFLWEKKVFLSESLYIVNYVAIIISSNPVSFVIYQQYPLSRHFLPPHLKLIPRTSFTIYPPWVSLPTYIGWTSDKTHRRIIRNKETTNNLVFFFDVTSTFRTLAILSLDISLSFVAHNKFYHSLTSLKNFSTITR